MTQASGEIEKIQVEQKSYEKTQIEWRIHDFLSVAENRKPGFHVFSPSFSTADESPLHFSLYPSFNGYVFLYLRKPPGLTYAAEYKLGFKKSDGSLLNFVSKILKAGIHSGEIRTLESSELLSRKYEFFPDNVLTVTCTLWREITHLSQAIALEEKKPLKLIRLNTLSENFQALFRDTETCDTTLKLKNRDYKAHRSVLIARSPVFAATFKHDTSEKRTGVITIPDCDPDSFQIFLEFLYCGRLEEVSFRDACSLYVTSDKYDVQELKQFCVEYLMQGFTVENICEVVVFADKYDEMQLFSAVQDFFIKNVFEILLTPEWGNLMKKDCRLANKLLTEFSKANIKQGDPK